MDVQTSRASATPLPSPETNWPLQYNDDDNDDKHDDKDVHDNNNNNDNKKLKTYYDP